MPRNEEYKSDISRRRQPVTGFYLIIVVAAAVIINLFFFRLSLVNGYSMIPSLDNHDLVVVRLFNLYPVPGDIVLTTKKNISGVRMIKRVLAVGGQRVTITGSDIFVDGAPIDLPEALPNNETGAIIVDRTEFIIPDGYYFLVGDNYCASVDSRVLGSFSKSDIYGIVVLRVFPKFTLYQLS